MKVITEAILRDELRNTQPETYYIPEGKLLSPAAREYLQQRKIKISKECKPEETPVVAQPVAQPQAEGFKPKFIDYVTGAFYMGKPEHMTHLYGNVLVVKNHPRIVFRGKLDSLQSLVVLNQALIAESSGSERLLGDLSNILSILREMMRCDVLDEAFHNECIIGLNHAELRERSHDPMKFYRIQQMTLPDYTMGKHYALLNQLRTAVRECEVSAAQAFHEGGKYTREDIIEELNRLSSALHIMMCKYLAGDYR
ncbi:ATP-binding protein [Oscillospiraceae bacterium PP1C4]